MKAKLHAFRNTLLFAAAERSEGIMHQPNCSAVTNAELANTIAGVWPSQQGQAQINYVFSLPAFFFFFNPDSRTFHLRSLPFTTVQAFQQSVRLALQIYESLNGGIFRFTEMATSFKTRYSPFYRGIFYAQAATEAQFSTNGDGAFTVLRFDNNGFIKQGIIYLPTDISIYNDLTAWNPYDWINLTIAHETSHALGGQHLQDFPDILTKLQNTPDGVFCSIMDYYTLISTNISACQENCTPAFAIYPASLDIRSMQLAYQQGNYDAGFDKTPYYIINALELFILFGTISFTYHLFNEFFSALQYRENTAFIAARLLHTLFNIGILTLFIALEGPPIVPIIYGVSALIGAIPDSMLQRAAHYRNQPKIQKFLASSFPLYILGITTVFAEGTEPAAFFLAAFFTGAALFIGLVGGLLGKRLMIKCANHQLQKLVNYFSPEYVVIDLIRELPFVPIASPHGSPLVVPYLLPQREDKPDAPDAAEIAPPTLTNHHVQTRFFPAATTHPASSRQMSASIELMPSAHPVRR